MFVVGHAQPASWQPFVLAFAAVLRAVGDRRLGARLAGYSLGVRPSSAFRSLAGQHNWPGAGRALAVFPLVL